MTHVDRLGRALADLRSADAGAAPWPADVPQLTPDLSGLRDVEDRTAYELACFAGSFLLLHETCHALKIMITDEQYEKLVADGAIKAEDLENERAKNQVKTDRILDMSYNNIPIIDRPTSKCVRRRFRKPL